MVDLLRKGSKLIRYLYKNKKFPVIPKEIVSYYLLPAGYSLYPRNIAIELTARCNLRCAMCWWPNLGLKEKKEYLASEMSLEEIKRVVAEIKKFVPSLGLTGGEPFVRTDILEIIECIVRTGLSLGILTNGTLIDKDIANTIVDLGVRDLGISIDGGKNAHDSIRGLEGSFDRTIDAIKNIQEIKKKKDKEFPSIRINCVISSLNANELNDMVDVAAELGVELQFQHVMWLTKVTVQRHIRLMREQFSIDDLTMKGFENNLNALDIDTLVDTVGAVKKKADNMNVRLFFQQFDDAKSLRTWYGTSKVIHAGHSGCYYPHRGRIRSNGDVTPCPFISYAFGNIKQQAFNKIWNGERARHFRKVFRENGRIFPGCIRCCKI